MAQNASAARRRALLRDGVWLDVVVVSPFITCLRVLDRSVVAKSAASGGDTTASGCRGSIIPAHTCNYKTVLRSGDKRRFTGILYAYDI
jgi:hypothetical protein